MLTPILAALAAILLEVSFFSHLRPLGVVPNLAIIAITFAALWSQATPTLVAAIIAGLLLDSASGVDFGLRTAFLAALAVSAIAARQLGLHTDSLVVPLGIVALATILFNLAVVLSIPGGPQVWSVVASRITVELIVNLMITGCIWLVVSAWRSRHISQAGTNRGSWM